LRNVKDTFIFIQIYWFVYLSAHKNREN